MTYAATGDSLILGRTNASQRTTELIKRGPGPALALKTLGNKEPSLRVSSDARVRRLNADKLDGQHAWQLSSKAVSYNVGEPGSVSGMICGVLDLASLGARPHVYVADSGSLLDGDSLTRINARTVKNAEPAPSLLTKSLVGSAAR